MSGYSSRGAELLGNLQEECAEVIKIASKINRFEVNTEKREHLGEEIGDIIAMVEMLVNEGHVSLADIEKGYHRKRNKMDDGRHMAYNKDNNVTPQKD